MSGVSTKTADVTGDSEPQHRPGVTRFPPVAQPINESVLFVDAVVDPTAGQGPIMDNRQSISTKLIGVEDKENGSLAYTAGDTTTSLQGRFCLSRTLQKIPHICLCLICSSINIV